MVLHGIQILFSTGILSYLPVSNRIGGNAASKFGQSASVFNGEVRGEIFFSLIFGFKEPVRS